MAILENVFLCLFHFYSSLYYGNTMYFAHLVESQKYLASKTFFLANLSTKLNLLYFWSLNCDIFRKKCKHILSVFSCPNEFKNV